MTPTDPAQPIPPLDNLQGGIIGFNKNHQRLLYGRFTDQATARAFILAATPMVARATEVLAFNSLFKQVHDRGGSEGTVEASWVNVALSAAGLQVLGAPEFERLPEEFRSGMAARAAANGDVDQSAPGTWVAPFNDPASVHLVVTIAADDLNDLERCYGQVKAIFDANGITELGQQNGNTRPGEFRGHEHFGFKDGISQPAIRGLTTSSKVGQDEIAPGEFIVGYPDQDGNISGGLNTAEPQPGQAGYGGTPPTPTAGLPAWTKDGAFVVLRRLRQDVSGFNAFVEQQAASVDLTAEQLGAKLVGRYKSGCPLERTRDQAPDFDPTTADPSIADPSMLSNEKVDNFEYEPHDTDGHLVPRAAHIRKMNPRNSNPPGKEESDRHRILRRGIPYGEEFQPGESPYPGSAPPPDHQDRGLLFVCYQSSIARGFEFIQQSWANREDFPQAQDGRDPIISQDVADPKFLIPPREAHLTTQRWVITTGGEYLFAPSISALRFLGGAP